ncbi:MAG: beta-phosphoglucomutase family hydrolase [Chloroflexota bacterium]
MTIKALIFDLDGVLVDTMPLHFRAWEFIADQHNRPFDTAMRNSFRGLPQHKCLARLFDSAVLSPEERHDILQQKNTTYQTIIRETAPSDLLADGVLALLASAKSHDLRLGIASSSVSAEMVIRHTGLIDIVDTFADGLVVNNGKPATDIFVWVAGALGVAPRQAVVFEDGDVGLQAANTAGMTTVGIGNGQWLAQADYQFSAMRDVNLEMLLQPANIQNDKEAI